MPPESIVIEVKAIYDKQNAIKAEIYRVPNTNDHISIERYDEFVTKLSQTKMDIIIGTDQNFDLMKVHTNRNVSDVLDVFFIAGVLPTVRRSTCVTHTSATVIDNIYMKCAGYDNRLKNIDD